MQYYLLKGNNSFSRLVWSKIVTDWRGHELQLNLIFVFKVKVGLLEFIFRFDMELWSLSIRRFKSDCKEEDSL